MACVKAVLQEKRLNAALILNWLVAYDSKLLIVSLLDTSTG